MVDCLLIVIDEMSGQSYADLNRLKALTSTGVIYLRRNNAPAVVPDGLDLGELTDEDAATLGALLARYDACFGTEPHEQASVVEFVALRPASSRPYAAMYAS